MYWGEYQFPRQITKANQMSRPGLLGGMHTHEGLAYFKRHFQKIIPEIAEAKYFHLEQGVNVAQFPKGVFAKLGSYKNAKTVLNGAKLQGIKTLWSQKFSLDDILRAGKETFNQTNRVDLANYQGFFAEDFPVQTWSDHLEKIIKNVYPKLPKE